MPKRISPIDCRHVWRHFIQSHRSSGDGCGRDPEREFVTVCRDCGEFRVAKTIGSITAVTTFTLATPEAVEAAGRYLAYLEAEPCG